MMNAGLWHAPSALGWPPDRGRRERTAGGLYLPGVDSRRSVLARPGAMAGAPG
jgi:hypothetical protein